MDGRQLPGTRENLWDEISERGEKSQEMNYDLMILEILFSLNLKAQLFYQNVEYH
jgi:hypothetical protein